MQSEFPATPLSQVVDVCWTATLPSTERGRVLIRKAAASNRTQFPWISISVNPRDGPRVVRTIFTQVESPLQVRILSFPPTFVN